MEFIEGLAASGGLDEAFEFCVRLGGGYVSFLPAGVRLRGFKPSRGRLWRGDFSGAARGKRDGAALRLAGCFGILVGGCGRGICLRPRRFEGRGVRTGVQAAWLFCREAGTGSGGSRAGRLG